MLFEDVDGGVPRGYTLQFRAEGCHCQESEIFFRTRYVTDRHKQCHSFELAGLLNTYLGVCNTNFETLFSNFILFSLKMF